MKVILGEYGIIVIVCLAVAMALLVFGMLISDGDSGLAFVYNTDHIYDNDVLSASDVVAEQRTFTKVDGATTVIENSRKPNFVVTTTEKSDYVIPVPEGVLNGTESTVTSGYTYDEVVKMFSMNDKLKLSLWDGTKYVNYSLPSDKVELVITKYVPVTSGIDGGFVLEEVDALDKFGNYIYDENGVRLQQTEVAYAKTLYTRDNIADFYINWDEEARFSVIFRYQEGTLKAEFSSIFANDMRPSYSIYTEVYEWWSDWYEVDENGNEVTNP